MRQKLMGFFLEAVASAGPYIYIQIYIAPKIMRKNLRCWKFWWYFGDHMQIICTLLLIDNHTNTSLLFCSISDLEIFLTLFISSSPGFIQKSSQSPLFRSVSNSPSSQACSDLLMLSCFITFWWCSLQCFSYLPTYINYCNCGEKIFCNVLYTILGDFIMNSRELAYRRNIQLIKFVLLITKTSVLEQIEKKR